MKKVIILRKIYVKMKSFAPPQNRKYQLLQIPKATSGGVLQRTFFFKISQNLREASVPEETSMSFAKFSRTTFFKNNSGQLLLKCRHCNNKVRDIA